VEQELAGLATGATEGTRGAGRGAERDGAGCGAATLEKAAATPRWRLPRRSHACGTMEELAVVTRIERWENDPMRAAVVKENVAGLFFLFGEMLTAEWSRSIGPDHYTSPRAGRSDGYTQTDVLAGALLF
jgi:hypothetical protein